MRDKKMISGFFQHIECIQIAGQPKLPSEEVFMEIKNYYELAKNDTLLIADERSLRVIFNLGHEHLITNIYKKVFVTPEIYNSIIKSPGCTHNAAVPAGSPLGHSQAVQLSAGCLLFSASSPVTAWNGSFYPDLHVLCARVRFR